MGKRKISEVKMSIASTKEPPAGLKSNTPRSDRNYVLVVSDGTGGTASRALKAALTQFEGIHAEIEVRSSVNSEEQIHDVVHEAAELEAIIIHTFVSNEFRRRILQFARHHNVPTVDLLGPLLDRLSERLAVEPSEKPGLFRHLNEDYFRRIETMEFAVKHDDGCRSDELHLAEIVLVGVSRTFKTPVSIYLAFKGWLVANVPIVAGIEPPSELFTIPPCNVFGFTMHARRLALLRTTRVEYLQNSVPDYSDLDFVREELMHALRIFRRSPEWPVINVGGKPVEEIASEIVMLRSKSHPTS